MFKEIFIRQRRAFSDFLQQPVECHETLYVSSQVDSSKWSQDTPNGFLQPQYVTLYSLIFKSFILSMSCILLSLPIPETESLLFKQFSKIRIESEYHYATEIIWLNGVILKTPE